MTAVPVRLEREQFASGAWAEAESTVFRVWTTH